MVSLLGNDLGRRAPRRALAGVVVGLLLVTACAPRTAPPVTTPQYPDFPFPAVPADLAGQAGAFDHEQGWRFLQTGDLRNAERRFGAALGDNQRFYPAEAGLGYVELARREADLALARFDRALAFAPGYAPALVGRGEALLAAGREEDALRAFEAAVAADASLADVRRRVEILRFRQVQAAVAEGRAATTAGRLNDARAAYERAIAISPESAVFYRELAAIEQQAGRLDRAAAHAWRAAELDPFDARALVILAEIQEAAGESNAAEASLARAYELDPSEELAARLEALRRRVRVARLPAPYAAIPTNPQVTRGELAALVGVQLERLLDRAPPQGTGLITDTRDHWAAPWILAVTRAGVMDVYANHTFQPAGVVRRGDLALVVSRLLELVGAGAPALARAWRSAQPTLADVGPDHLSYPAVAMAIGAGVLPVLEGNQFHLGRPVSGAEAVGAIQAIETLTARMRRP